MFIFVLILAALATPISGTRVKFTALECRSMDTAFCVFDHCIVKPVGRNVKEASVLIKMLQIPVTNVTIHAALGRRGNLNRPLYTFNIDGCRFMDTDNRNYIANSVYKFLRLDIHSNMNHSCPFDHDLIVDHLRIDDSFNVPLPLGRGDFTLKTYWSAYNVLRAIVTIIFTVV